MVDAKDIQKAVHEIEFEYTDSMIRELIWSVYVRPKLPISVGCIVWALCVSAIMYFLGWTDLGVWTAIVTVLLGSMLVFIYRKLVGTVRARLDDSGSRMVRYRLSDGALTEVMAKSASTVQWEMFKSLRRRKTIWILGLKDSHCVLPVAAVTPPVKEFLLMKLSQVGAKIQ